MHFATMRLHFFFFAKKCKLNYFIERLPVCKELKKNQGPAAAATGWDVSCKDIECGILFIK
jgi:hypothetical protein